MRKLFHIPLECYAERYTSQMSAPETGWLERNWRKAGVDFVRVDGESKSSTGTIKVGSVLDAIGRSTYAFSQIEKLLLLAQSGELTSEDAVFFSDFWHPGMEALPYAFQQMGLKPKLYAMVHAQSVDEYDFTYPMRRWMRPVEQGYGRILDGIFVTNSMLKDLLVSCGVAESQNVHITGLPFCSEEVRERIPVTEGARRDNVVFSSRFDWEKQPHFLLSVAQFLFANHPTATVTITTSAAKLRSSDKTALDALKRVMAQHPTRLILKEGLTKSEYYNELSTSKVQLNTALQDWVSWTLLEATLCGAYPVYPLFRSFPETFEYKTEFMYSAWDAASCANKLIEVLNRDDLWTPEAIQSRSWIYRRFDRSWERMLEVMTRGRVANPLYGNLPR